MASGSAACRIRYRRFGVRMETMVSLPGPATVNRPSSLPLTVPLRKTAPGSAGGSPKPEKPPAERCAEAGVPSASVGSSIASSVVPCSVRSLATSTPA